MRDAKLLFFFFAVVAFAGGCRRRTECDWGTQVGPWALKANWTGCADDKLRSVECLRTQSGFKYACIVGGGLAGQGAAGGAIVSSFVLPSLSSLEGRGTATSTANELCNWSLEP